MDRKITTIEEIKNHIENKNNFVLNGGWEWQNKNFS